MFKLDETILAGFSEEFKAWLQQPKSKGQDHFETFRQRLEAQTTVAANGVRLPLAVPGDDGSEDTDFDDADGDIDMLGKKGNER
eukprot:6171679-Pyramimonas_sp.AAC.1